MADQKISQLTAATTPLVGTEVVPIVQSGSTKKATIDQILAPASGKGIDFSAAGGDILTMYDEGTWTPVISASSGSVTSYTINSAKYTRIGRIVNLSFDYTITNNGTAGLSTVITGVPFNINGGANSAMGVVREVAAIGSSGVVYPSSTTQLIVIDYKNSYLGGNNFRVVGSIAYTA